MFGEGSYDFGQFKLTAGGRYYDFKETRDFISGGLFSNGDTILGDKTKSDGISPRVIATWEPNRNLSVNLQAAKGFRLGGINDPLNLALCSAQDMADLRSVPGEKYDDETLWNYEAGVKYPVGRSRSMRPFSTPRSGTCRSPSTPAAARRASFSTSTRRIRRASRRSSRHGPCRVSSCRWPAAISKPSSTPPSTMRCWRALTGIRDGNRLPSVPKFQMAATATYGSRFRDNADWYVSASFQHVGSRITQPGDQEPRGFRSNMIFYDPVTGGNGADGVFDWTSFLKLPSYNLVNLSAGLEFDSGLDVILYANNVFDENRQAGVRPRTRRPGAAWLPCRHAADDRADAAQGVPG